MAKAPVLARAASRAEEGEFQEAVALFQQAIAQSPQPASVHESLAQCLNEVGDYEGARDAASTATSLQPEEAGGGNDEAVQEEVGEVEQLWEQQVSRRVGLPQLKISQRLGSSIGPGAVVWEGGLCLAEYMVRFPALVKEKQVVELGSGTGIGGVTAALLGASRAVLTDLPPLLPLLTSTANRNGLKPPHVIVECLDWEDDSDVSPSLRDPSFDVVLAADPVYSASQVPGFVAAQSRLLGSDCIGLLAHKHRHAEVDSALFDGISAAGYSFEQRGVSCLDSRVKVYEIKQKNV